MNRNSERFAVHVQMEYGLWHYGTAVGVRQISQNPGFLVDFGSPRIPMIKCIPFDARFDICHWRHAGERFRRPNSRFTGLVMGPEDEYPVEAFLRLNVDEPWKWHPGMMIMLNFTGFADACCFVMVTAYLNGTSNLFVLPKERVRSPVSTTRPVASPFEKTELRFKLRMLGMRNTIQSWRKLNLPNNSRSPQQDAQNNGKQLLLSRVKIQNLPAEVMMEVFICIETTAQSRLRSVYSGWNSLLTSSPLQRFLLFTGSTDDPSHRYSNIACLHACWRPIIIFAGCSASRSPSDTTILSGPLLRQIMERGGHRCAETLILSGVAWNWSAPSRPRTTSGRRDFVMTACLSLSVLAAVCHTLLIKDIHMIDLFYSYSKPCFPACEDYKPEFTRCILRLRIRDGRIRGRGLTIEDWWNLLESSCPSLKASQVQSLSNWMEECLQTDATSVLRDQWSDADDRNRSGAIPIILQEFQRMDPRAGNQYPHVRLDEWTEIKPPLATLSKLTVYALRTLQLQPKSPATRSFCINLDIPLISNEAS
ncbi:uncharacterized protein LOC129582308 [Paramacrobiotus metropolitanus]|uniref:uncharacterized protein LOC129582308 n=1 Tax=Paramacrobiotus metropolitanus TaxID=2943436 RepID=UPI00244644BE|nr:uncharacterized protein LOC129582308 [Paramacrobiotus metropolitanus]